MPHAVPATQPYDFAKHLAYAMRDPREPVDHTDPARREWSRVLLIHHQPALVRVREAPDGVHVDIEPEPTDPTARRATLNTVAHMISAPQDVRAYEKAVANDAPMARLAARQTGLKPLLLPSAYEALVWAVLGQQITLAYAHTLKARLVKQWGVEGPGGRRGYPRPEVLAKVTPDELRPHGFSKQKATYLANVARAELDGHLHIATLDDDAAVETLQDIRGVGRWTAEYTLLRGLGRLDAIPAMDVGLQNAAARVHDLTPRPTEPELRRMAEAWRPYRGWAAFHLWYTFVRIKPSAASP